MIFDSADEKMLRAYGCLDGIDAATLGYLETHYRRYRTTLDFIASKPRARILELGTAPPFVFNLMLARAFPEADIALAYNPDRSSKASFDRRAPGGRLKLLSKQTEFPNLSYPLYAFNAEKEVWPFPVESFDLVICMEILEHILLDPCFLFREAHRVLSPGGSWVVTTPNVASLEGVYLLLENHAPYRFGPYSPHGEYGRHNREYAPRELAMVGEACGFATGRLTTHDVYPVLADVTRVRSLLESAHDDLSLREQTIFYEGVRDERPFTSYPPALISYDPPEYAATLRLHRNALPARISVEAANIGRSAWQPADTCLGVQLLDGLHHILRDDFLRVSLPRVIEPGSYAVMEFDLPDAGEGQILKIDMLHGAHWFSMHDDVDAPEIPSAMDRSLLLECGTGRQVAGYNEHSVFVPAPSSDSELAQIRERVRLLREESRKIGQVPPRPPTLRASMSGALVSLLHRLTFWYTPPLQQTIGGLVNSLEDTVRCLENMLADQARALHQEQAHRVALQESWQRELQQERGATLDLENIVREQADTSRQFQEDRVSREEELAGQLQRAEERLQLLRRELLDQSRRVAKLLDEAHPGTPSTPAVQHASTNLEALHAAFEYEIRGTRVERQERLKAYLPSIPRDATVLDLGCGRGEWLELLRGDGISAHGVDANRLMVEECRERQLEAERADVLDYLARTGDASLGAVTAFHLIEHLPLHDLVRLLDEVARVLQPGGVVIFETPNPDNVLVGSRDFYLDPTHRHPIPSETLKALMEDRGLQPGQVLSLNPCDPSTRLPGEEDSLVIRRFNQYFYGPRDYGVVGKKA